MLSQAFRKLFPDPFGGMAGEVRQEFVRNTGYVNFTRARVFAAVLVALMIPLILVDLQNRTGGVWAAEPGYRSLFVLHLVIAGVFLLYSAAACLLRPQDPSAVTLRHRLLAAAFAVLGLLLPAAVSVNDQLIHGQITVFLIAAFWVAAGLSLDAITGFVLYAGVTALLMAGIHRFQQDPNVIFGHSINAPLLALLAWLLSCSLYRARAREFVQGTIIQQQRLQVKELETRQLLLEREKLREAVDQSTRSLQESEAKFRALAETSTAAIIIHRGEKCLYANPAAETITGYIVGELLEREFPVLVHPEHRSMVREREQAAMAGGTAAVSCELKVLRKSFEERWVMMTAGRVEFDGRPAVIATLYDIDDRKRLEGRLRFAERFGAGGRQAANGGPIAGQKPRQGAA